jgi:5-methylcytosine-specific restriction endonuclease McrA
MFLTGRTTCIKCGIKGDHFHIERHKNDKVMPYSVNLYGWKGDREVLMTWDHILPRSLGGSNRLENAQCMCTECNGDKGSRLSIYEVIAIVTDHNAALMYRDEVVHPKSTIFITLAQVMAEWNKL